MTEEIALSDFSTNHSLLLSKDFENRKLGFFSFFGVKLGSIFFFIKRQKIIYYALYIEFDTG